MALIIALCAGLAVEVFATAITFLYPIDAQSSAEGLLRATRLFLQDYRQYLPMPVALLAIALAVVLFKRPARI